MAAIPEKIGKYEVRLQIGRGGMGVVYEGFDPVIGRRVAIKTLRTENIEPGDLPEFLARFKREAQSAGRLSHPHIVTIHEYGEQDDMPYIVMEYIQGRDLSQDLKRGIRFRLEDVVRMMTQLLGALGHAHEAGVVHRDIKPQNIILLEDGSLKVVDFGIARIEESEAFTKTGAMIGTPAYMSPEQVMGQHVTARSDLFSVGTVLYQLLTGDRPFSGDDWSIKQKVLKQEPMPPSELNPILSAPWDAVVARAMAKKPEARYDSARQMLEAIRAAAEAEQRAAEEERRKRIEAEEHANREAAARSREEAARREQAARQAALDQASAARAEAERAKREAAEAQARREAAERTVAVPPATPAPPKSRAPIVFAAIAIIAVAAGALLYTRGANDGEAKKAEAARKAEEAKKLAARKPGDVFRDCPDCPRMVVIPAGEFTMGSPASEASRDGGEGPQRRVTIAASFALGRNEVTVAEFRRFAEATGYRTDAEKNTRAQGCFGFNYADTSAKKPDWQPGKSWRDPGFEQAEAHPVVCVSWNDANAYAEWLAKRTGQRYRLPSEAEWEYAVRAGTTTARYWGDDPSQACRHANVADQSRWQTWSFGNNRHECNDGHYFTAPAGSYPPNRFGLYDMLGNAHEWTEDCWNASYNGAPADGTVWRAGDCALRVLRGGSWGIEPRGVRSANRNWNSTDVRLNNLGFRLARTLE